MLTRRKLLNVVGATGGSVALYGVAAALGVVPTQTAAASLTLPAPRDGRNKVLILGAGIAGLVAAYELSKAGYQVDILEASERIGGRSLTLRHGDVVDEIGNRQVCQFDDEPHLYMEAGPARIPAYHTNILEYCRELGVALQTYNNSNPAAWAQFDKINGGERVRQRELQTDARGFITELLSKSISEQWLDDSLSELDGDRLLEFLTRFGDLNSDHQYAGSSRSGYANNGLMAEGLLLEPHGIEEIVASDFWRIGMNFSQAASQSSVLVPVGGMDKILDAFVAKLPNVIQTNSRVVDIRTSDSNVTVQYQNKGQMHTSRADYCLNSIPGQILAGVANNFDSEFQKTLETRPRGKLSKIGLQMNNRFWEKEGIYGGNSWTGQDITQIMYPSHGYHQNKGVVIGGYIYSGAINDKVMSMSAEQRIEMAKRQGEKVHPGYANAVENGVSVAWYRMNHILGCTARNHPGAVQHVLQAPQGRHYLIGDQAAHHSGWQESAVLSAHFALNHITQRETGQSSLGRRSTDAAGVG
jgi:monoamine oxidase